MTLRIVFASLEAGMTTEMVVSSLVMVVTLSFWILT